jgi:hypothetical protein
MATMFPWAEPSTANEVLHDPGLLFGDVAAQSRVEATSVTGCGGTSPHPPSGPWRVTQNA